MIAKKDPHISEQKNQRGSLTLEQALFVGAIVSMFSLVSIFYTNLGNYFSGITFGASPTNIGSTSNNP